MSLTAICSVVEPVRLPSPPLRTYVVRKGDTLAAIARKHGCSSSIELARLNHLKPPGFALRVGQDLRVAGCVRN